MRQSVFKIIYIMAAVAVLSGCSLQQATRNAGEMIKKQTQLYNRSRQAMITKELIEIISGAEAL